MTTSAHHRLNHHPVVTGLLSDIYLLFMCFPTAQDFLSPIPPNYTK